MTAEFFSLQTEESHRSQWNVPGTSNAAADFRSGSLRDSDGKTLRMPVPLKIKLATATGRNLFEDYAATDEKGELEKKINIPLNLDAGTATFSITELASGGKTSAIVSLE